MAETTVKHRAFAFIVFVFQSTGISSALFLAQYKHKAYGVTHVPGFHQTVFLWWRSWHGSIWDCVSGPFYHMQRSVAEGKGGNQRVSLQKCANLMIACIPDRFTHARHCDRSLIRVVIDAYRWNLSEIEAVFSC